MVDVADFDVFLHEGVVLVFSIVVGREGDNHHQEARVTHELFSWILGSGDNLNQPVVPPEETRPWSMERR